MVLLLAVDCRYDDAKSLSCGFLSVNAQPESMIRYRAAECRNAAPPSPFNEMITIGGEFSAEFKPQPVLLEKDVRGTMENDHR